MAERKKKPRNIVTENSVPPFSIRAECGRLTSEITMQGNISANRLGWEIATIVYGVCVMVRELKMTQWTVKLVIYDKDSRFVYPFPVLYEKELPFSCEGLKEAIAQIAEFAFPIADDIIEKVRDASRR